MAHRIVRTLMTVVVGAFVTSAAHAQTSAPPNTQPNTYQGGQSWGRLPPGRVYGNTSAVHVDARDVVWVADKCGGTTCAGRPESPIMAFDPSGALLTSFGSGSLVAAHGLYVDGEGNVWVTDFMDQDGKGQRSRSSAPKARCC